MPHINLPTSRHRAPADANLPDGLVCRWRPFRSASHIQTLRSVFGIFRQKIRNYSPCNDAFRNLPRGRSFRQLFDDTGIWISYDPSNRQGYFGATTGKEITISEFSFRMGIWTVAGTLVHELAHVNGATGSTRDAESTLMPCLFQDVYNPNVMGSVVKPGAETLYASIRSGGKIL